MVKSGSNQWSIDEQAKRRRGKPESSRELCQILQTDLNSQKIEKLSPRISCSLPKERKN